MVSGSMPSRRIFLSSCMALTAMKIAAMAKVPGFVQLSYSGGRLAWLGGGAPAACGRGGVRADKREGDGATPAGIFPLIRAFYRADRLTPPATFLPMQALRPSDGWVDDPSD